MNMELLELFDINEKRIGKQIVRGYEPDDGEYIMIVYIFIINSEGKVLLEKNKVTLSWVVPGGHVNSGVPQRNIERECMEELGIQINVSNLRNVDSIIKNRRIFKIYSLRQDIDLNNIKLQTEEVIDANFFSIDEIEDMEENGRIRENNLMFIDVLKKYLHR